MHLIFCYWYDSDEASRINASFVAPPPVSIDYCHLRPQHVMQINELLREEFWPGIDSMLIIGSVFDLTAVVSDSLQCPEFSIVALYKKKVIGCGFVTPAGYISYIAVHPEWRRCGMGTFMLYHLVTVFSCYVAICM